MALALVFGTVVALLVGLTNLPARGVLSVLVLIAMMIPPHVTAIAWTMAVIAIALVAVQAILSARSAEDFTAAVRALDRVLMAGRHVIPIWANDVGRIAHLRQLRHPDRIPVYGDRITWMPDVWWWQED